MRFDTQQIIDNTGSHTINMQFCMPMHQLVQAGSSWKLVQKSRQYIQQPQNYHDGFESLLRASCFLESRDQDNGVQDKYKEHVSTVTCQ